MEFHPNGTLNEGRQNASGFDRRHLFLDVGCGDDSARRARTLTASGSRQDFSRLSSRLSVEKISHNSAQLMKA
jgi:hypothetical protein